MISPLDYSCNKLTVESQDEKQVNWIRRAAQQKSLLWSTTEHICLSRKKYVVPNSWLLCDYILYGLLYINQPGVAALRQNSSCLPMVGYFTEKLFFLLSSTFHFPFYLAQGWSKTGLWRKDLSGSRESNEWLQMPLSSLKSEAIPSQPELFTHFLTNVYTQLQSGYLPQNPNSFF